MAHEVCNEITEWIEEEVAQPVERWVDQLQQTCQQQSCNWWCLCCNKWLCWLAWVVVKVIEWVIVTVGKWVTHTVCEIIATVVDVIVAVVTGLVDIFVGLFTGDWARMWDGLVTLVGGAFQGAIDLARIAFLGDTISYFGNEVNKGRLRDYVRNLLEQKYAGAELQAIKDALGVDYGAFGFRMAARAIRTFVRSDFRLPRADAPELIKWHEDPNLRLNLKWLAGYDYEEFWRRFRPEVAGVTSSISESDIDAYISSRGVGGKVFSIFCMSESVLDTKISTASEKARALGLLFRWKKGIVQVTRPEDVRFQETSGALVSFLKSAIGRKSKAADPAGAVTDLCTIPTVGVFRYEDKLNGIAANLEQGSCDGLGPNDASGVTFMDRLPDLVWRYVQIHEMGHYFGLCHVDGLNRIMYTANAIENKSAWDWWLIPDYLYLNGGPTFVFDEATKVWDYIVNNFSGACLSVRAS